MAKPNKSEKEKRANEAAQRRAQAAREKVAAAARKTNDDLREDGDESYQMLLNEIFGEWQSLHELGGEWVDTADPPPTNDKPLFDE